MGTTAAAAALAEADVVLLAGTKAGGGATYNWTLPRPDQPVVQLDLDPAELGRAFPWAAPVLADARAGLRALLAALAADAGRDPDAGRAPDRARWRSRLAELTLAWRAERDQERASAAVPIAPRAAQQAAGPALVDVVTETWQTPITAHRRAVGEGPATTGTTGTGTTGTGTTGTGTTGTGTTGTTEYGG